MAEHIQTWESEGKLYRILYVDERYLIQYNDGEGEWWNYGPQWESVPTFYFKEDVFQYCEKRLPNILKCFTILIDDGPDVVLQTTCTIKRLFDDAIHIEMEFGEVVCRMYVRRVRAPMVLDPYHTTLHRPTLKQALEWVEQWKEEKRKELQPIVEEREVSKIPEPSFSYDDIIANCIAILASIPENKKRYPIDIIVGKNHLDIVNKLLKTVWKHEDNGKIKESKIALNALVKEHDMRAAAAKDKIRIEWYDSIADKIVLNYE